ncbi:MAG: hypothetical protein IJJ50_05490 [Lachnospiraceae bacterium]|nr:hypothetical protein [Lachnospiraceae bacterium]
MMIFLLCVITIAIFLFGFFVISKVDDFLGDWRRDFDEDYDTRRDAARQSRKDSKGCRLFKKSSSQDIFEGRMIKKERKDHERSGC